MKSLYHTEKLFKISKITRNELEKDNVKLTHIFQALATTNDIEATTDEVSNTTFHQPTTEKDTVNAIAESPVEKTIRP